MGKTLSFISKNNKEWRLFAFCPAFDFSALGYLFDCCVLFDVAE